MTAKRPPGPEDWRVTPLQADLVVTTRAPPLPPNAAVESRVAALWAEALEQHPRLYNGRVFCATTIAPERIDGYWAEYCLSLAQMRDPALFDALALCPLAVTGLLFTPDGVVIGRRSAHALYLPGCWQGVPAGTVESRAGDGPVDLRAQLAAELWEELGLDPADAAIGAPFLACAHPGTHIVDIAMPIRTPLSFATIEKGWRDRGNDEYDRLILLPPSRDALSRGDLLPTTRVMIEALCP